jgi:hypothetical protein
MDSDFETINNYIYAIWKLDEATFASLIADDAVITYTFNGVPTTSDKKTFIERLHVGHFTNTLKRNMIKISIEKVVTGTYLVTDICVMERNGQGRDETGPGSYYYDSHGKISVSNGKVTKIDYHFKKNRI